MSKIQKATEKVVEGYEKIEEAVVGGYKKVEDTVVGSFTKVADQFVDSFLTKDGESVEEAKERLAQEQQTRQDQLHARIEESLKISRNAGKRN